jgi:uncharacterized protein YbjQ (UPF0145 family)
LDWQNEEEAVLDKNRRQQGHLRLLGITALALLVATQAAGRDTTVELSAHEVAQSSKGRDFLLDVPFWMKGEPHELEGEALQVSSVTRTSSAVMRSDRAACMSAFLDALKVLQQKALDAGGNAVVDIVSVTRDVETESAQTFRCVAGATVARVGLRATLMRLPE